MSRHITGHAGQAIILLIKKKQSRRHFDDGINLSKFGANMGSMVSIPQRDRAVSMVTDAVAEGGKIIAGGRPLNRDGAFFEPTIIDCEPDNSIARHEVFRPMLSVMRFDQDDTGKIFTQQARPNSAHKKALQENPKHKASSNPRRLINCFKTAILDDNDHANRHHKGDQQNGDEQHP